MSSGDFREPTNDELWAQPPTAAQPAQSPHGLAPMPQPPLPAPAHQPFPPAPAHQPLPPAQAGQQDRTVFVLAIVSIAVGIPLTAIAGGVAGLRGLIVAWIGIVLVNAIYARSRRNR